MLEKKNNDNETDIWLYPICKTINWKKIKAFLRLKMKRPN